MKKQGKLNNKLSSKQLKARGERIAKRLKANIIKVGRV